MPFDRARLSAGLAGRPRDEAPAAAGGRRAAVAALLRWEADGPEVLLMKRAEFAGDRWSGQVSMPGGREDPGDADLAATARRETLEEVGIDLARAADLVGRLEATQAIARGKIVPMTITPFVYAQTTPVTITPNREVASWFWLPLGPAARGDLDARYTWSHGPESVTLPAWRFEEHVVWGLTYRMLRDLLAAAG